MMSTDASNIQVALEFKSTSFSVPVLVIATDDMGLIEDKLQEKVRKAPEFFKNSPLILDLQEANNLGCLIDFFELAGLIRKEGLLLICIRGGDVKQNKQALELQIPVLSVSSRDLSLDDKKQKSVSQELESNVNIKSNIAATTLITHPIRSGQRIYAEGDLVILTQVSAGAEIIAEGNIHVYNTLRGRALAGVQGDIDARIFCFDLQAELISIAGNYKVSEDLSESVRNKPVQVYLQDQALIIKDIVLHH
jgi:septum site-determining protein MinC